MRSDRLKHTPLPRLARVSEQIRDGAVITQYAAICVRQNTETGDDPEILLITSRDTGRWIIPKGWGMGNKRPHKVAQREAWEEAGVVGRADAEPCGFYTYVKSFGKGEFAPALVQVHMLTVSHLERKFPEKGQRVLKWFPVQEASAAVFEPELKSLLARVPALLKSG